MLVRENARKNPEKIACLYLENDQVEKDKISYKNLDRKASLVAQALNDFFKDAKGRCVILLFPTGIDFIISFLGCSYAQAIAVPVTWPAHLRNTKELSQLKSIIQETKAEIMLVPSEFNQIKKDVDHDLGINIFDISQVEMIKEGIDELPIYEENTISHLQFTSGSTSTPKGVIIKQASLMHSLYSASSLWNFTEHSISLTWAPHTYAYGLLYCLLLPLYKGALSIIMSSEAFIKSPLCWLNAISKYKVTHSGSSNFAYDYCVSEISENNIQDLDLSCWKSAINGGEPIQQETLIAFSQKYNQYHFKLENFICCYGMSEAAGLIACNTFQNRPNLFHFNKKALRSNTLLLEDQHDRTKTFLGYAHRVPELQITIRDVKTLEVLNHNKVGEIWLTGPTCSCGYWEIETDIYQNNLAHSENYPSIRTGDLGCLYDNQLIVMGRIKELLVIADKNYFPVDIELSAANSYNKLKKGSNAVFVISNGSKDEVVLVQVVLQDVNENEYLSIVHAIHHAVKQEHNLIIDRIVLIENNQLAKTPSGKVQRGLCKKLYISHELEIKYEWRHFKNIG